LNPKLVRNKPFVFKVCSHANSKNLDVINFWDVEIQKKFFSQKKRYSTKMVPLIPLQIQL